MVETRKMASDRKDARIAQLEAMLAESEEARMEEKKEASDKMKAVKRKVTQHLVAVVQEKKRSADTPLCSQKTRRAKIDQSPSPTPPDLEAVVDTLFEDGK